ncbi:hypothetical protein MMC07_003625 [Pseudocyphellaria aurata]|nr:hypothetical protein [Pseudocyphellaria aurata]
MPATFEGIIDNLNMRDTLTLDETVRTLRMKETKLTDLGKVKEESANGKSPRIVKRPGVNDLARREKLRAAEHHRPSGPTTPLNTVQGLDGGAFEGVFPLAGGFGGSEEFYDSRLGWNLLQQNLVSRVRGRLNEHGQRTNPKGRDLGFCTNDGSPGIAANKRDISSLESELTQSVHLLEKRGQDHYVAHLPDGIAFVIIAITVENRCESSDKQDQRSERSAKPASSTNAAPRAEETDTTMVIHDQGAPIGGTPDQKANDPTTNQRIQRATVSTQERNPAVSGRVHRLATLQPLTVRVRKSHTVPSSRVEAQFRRSCAIIVRETNPSVKSLTANQTIMAGV